MPRPKKARAVDRPYLVDTNVLVRFLVGDDPAKAARARALMTRVDQGQESIVITEEVLTECVWVLESFYEVPRHEIAQRLAALLAYRGIQNPAASLSALGVFAKSNLDFVDCMLVARSQRDRLPVYSFDEADFKKFAVEWKSP